MHISPVSFTRPVFYGKNVDKNNNLTNAKTDYQASPAVSLIAAKSYFLSFKGGASVNLAQTMQNFEEAEILKDEKLVPARVHELSDKILQKGNPNDFTLIDVHKLAYEDLKYAETLEEAKALYPEFKDVLSMDEVEAKEGSFLDNVKKGKNEYFSNDEDLALQLLKLYWAEGFSVNDLGKYVNNDGGIAYALRKLNIPLVNRHHGIVLKYSDKEYNERMAEEMSARQIEYLEKNSAKTGYVHIPRGKMSEEQKKKISEALIDYYIKNPQRAYTQSMRQKEFYKNHPEEAEIFSLVVNDAWSLGSSKPVKEALKSFLKGYWGDYKAEKEKDFYNVNAQDAKMRAALRLFWDANPKAKEKFSVSMKCAWKRIKAMQEAYATKLTTDIPAYPIQIENRIRSWAEKNGYNPSDLNLKIIAYSGNKGILNKSPGARAITEFFNENLLISDVYADTLVFTLAFLRDYLLLPKNRSTEGYKIVNKIEREVKGKSYMTTNDLVHLYAEIIKNFSELDKSETPKLLAEMMNRGYVLAIKARKQEGLQVP